MPQTTPERQPCGTCGKPCSVNADGTVRHHTTNNPEWQANPAPHTSNKCQGAGQPPAGEGAEHEGPGQVQCRLCKHAAVLTSNGRIRSHPTPEQTPRPCPGGSDFPLGTYPDIIGTTDGLVATLASDCEHREVGACYDCAGVPVPGDVTQPTMADQFKDVSEGGEVAVHCFFDCGHVERSTDPKTAHDAMEEHYRAGHPGEGDGRPEASRFLELLAKETQGAGTVLDALPAGFDPTCSTCDTDDHRCMGCGTDVPHGTVACAECTTRVDAEDAERKAACPHPDGFRDTLSVDGREVPACEHCGAVGWFIHAGASGSSDCTHQQGFLYVGADQDDEDRHECPECGAPDPTDRAAEKVPAAEVNPDPGPAVPDTSWGRNPDFPDPELPNCPHPETHRASCGCPDDDSRDPADEWRTPTDMVGMMPEDVRGLDVMGLDCATCKHPVTPRVGHFDLYGKPASVEWGCREGFRSGYRVCRDHECTPNKNVRLGDLDEGDHFIRRGALMRLTEHESSTSVLAVVIGGPYDGRTGELKNLDETVERAPGPRTKEQETTECTDSKQAAQTSLRSSSASGMKTADPTTAPAPGSRPPTAESARDVSPESRSVTSSAPTARAAGNGRSAAVTTDQNAAAAAFPGSNRPPSIPIQPGSADQNAAAAQFLAGAGGTHGEKETKRDRFGRYLIPHPDTGKEQAWTRATTFAKSISDTYTLSQWQGRMTLLGVTMRPDIVQRAHGKHVKTDRDLLNELVEDLKKAAGDKVAANLGTAMHSFTELADRAWHTPEGPRSALDQVPPDARKDVETYIRLLEEMGLEPVPHLIEFTTVVKQYGVAGTSDNCYRVTRPLKLKIGRAEVRLSPGEHVIGDKKTGKDLDYGWQEIAIQLALYAQGLNTAGVWDRHEEVWHPDPLSRFDEPGTEVRTDVGIVVHLPVDKESDKTPTVYGVDLESGWNAAVLCERVRAWRKARNLASPAVVSGPAETFAPSRTAPEVMSRTTVRPASLRDRAHAVTSKGEASAVWKQAKADGLPDSEVDDLVQIMQVRLAELTEPGG